MTVTRASISGREIEALAGSVALRPPHVPEFHWLRSIACLGVVVIHTLTIARGYPDWEGAFLGFGVVQILLMFSTPTFVFLSAAQVGYSYARPPPDFLRKRIRYILVPYIVVNIAYGAFEALIRWRRHVDGSVFLSDWLGFSTRYLIGGSHLWFIIPIFQFYLIYAVLGRWLPSRRWGPILAVALAVNLAYLATFNFSAPLTGGYATLVGRHWFSFFVPAWIFYFAAGLWVGRSYDRFKLVVERNLPSILAGLVLAGAAVLFLHHTGILSDVSSRRADMLIYGSLVMAALLYAGSRLERIPRVLVEVSRRSFGMYLLHPFFLALPARGLDATLQSLPPLVGFLGLASFGIAASFSATGVLARAPGGSLVVGRVRQR